MATKRYTVEKRRKREGRTNYRGRIKLLASRKPRLVIRRHSKSILMQVVEFSPRGDKVVCSANSLLLKKLGWQGHTGNIPAAYLTGLYLAKKCGVSEAVVDFGEQHSVKGSSLYAAVKGAIDGGLKINCGEEMFPSPERISGKHTKNKEIFSRIKPKIEGEKKNA